MSRLIQTVQDLKERHSARIPSTTHYSTPKYNKARQVKVVASPAQLTQVLLKS